MLALNAQQLDYLNQSHAYLKQGNPDKAAEYAEALYKVVPNHPDTLLLLAEINYAVRNFNVGVEVLEKAISLYPSLSKLFERLGYGYICLESFDLAKDALREAVSLQADNVSAQLFLATVLEKLNEKALAIEIYEKCAESFNSVEIFSHLGAWYYDKDLAKSERYYRLARKIDPDSATLKIDLAAVIYLYLSTKRELSKDDYKRLLTEAKKLLGAVTIYDGNLTEEYLKRYYLNYSNLVGLSGDINESINLLLKLQDRYGDYGELINNLSLRFLLTKNFKEGFDYYRRAKALSKQDLGLQAKFNSGSGAPEWLGEDLSGKCLLLTSEQGVGDQVLSWSHLLHHRFANTTIILTCNEKLTSVAQRSFPGFDVCNDTELLSDELLEKVDYQVSVVDLCSRLFRSFEELVPKESFLVADDDKMQALRQKYEGFAKGRPLIGIAWDSFAPTGSLKSISLEMLKPLLKNKKFCFVSVQYSANNQALSQWCKRNSVDLIVDEDIDCFNDIDSSVAQIAALDSLVSISNASVHFAAALGKPVQLLLPTKPIWHWFDQGEDSIWYSSVKLYRQKTLGDWKPVVKSVLVDLKGQFGLSK